MDNENKNENSNPHFVIRENSPLTEIVEKDFEKFKEYYREHLPEKSIIQYENAMKFYIWYISGINGLSSYTELTKGMINSKFIAFGKKYGFLYLHDLYFQRTFRDFLWFVQNKLHKDIGNALTYID